jgi:hypothetical protein
MPNKANFRWADVERVMVGCSGGASAPMDDVQWKAFAKDLQTKHVSKFLQGVVGSVEVSTVQRNLVVDILKARKIQTVVITDERLVRGMITAASWAGADIKGFSWADVQKAVQAVTESSASAEKVLTTLLGLKLAVTPH